MKKLFLITAIAGMFAFSNVSAQTSDPAMSGSKLGIGAEFAFPMGDFSDTHKFGFGGSLQYQMPIADRLNLTGTAGYMTFKGKDIANTPAGDIKFADYSAIPVKVGARYFVAENFYAGGELGAAFGTGDYSETSFIYTPQIGVEFPVADKGSIDLGARYEAWSNNGTNGFFGLRLAYNFGL